MTIILNGGANPSAVTYNGTALTKVICNGTTVWEAATTKTWWGVSSGGLRITGLEYRERYAFGKPTSNYTIVMPSLAFSTSNEIVYQPTSGSPAWSSGYPFLGLEVTATFTKTDGSTITDVLWFKFENGVLTISTRLNLNTYGRLTVAAKTATVTGYLYTE